MAKSKQPKQEKYEGVLNGFAETGSEGVYWVLATGNEKIGFFGDIFIEPGDHLKVYGEDGKVVFDDVIVADTKTGWRKFYKNPKYGQQVALGCWVHWIQQGWQPNDWAKLFIKHWFKNWPDAKQLRAELTKKRQKAH